MMPRLSSCFPNVSQALQMFPAVSEDQLLSGSSSLPAAYAASDHSQYSTSLLDNLSILKDKMNQVQSLVSILVSSYQTQPDQSTSLAMTNMNSVIQEIIVAASSMMLTCQHMALLGSSSVATTTEEFNQPQHHIKLSSDNRLSQTNLNSRVGEASGQVSGHGFFCRETLDWFDENYPINDVKNDDRNVVVNETRISSRIRRRELKPAAGDDGSEEPNGISSKDCDIIELDAGDLLAKYTHYCIVCGKGFKRDANLRMHMRAHGDKYKTNAALSNPMKHSGGFGGNEDYSTTVPKKYSCPQEGCRWNKNHAKFQPLKSIICVKNHYKRSHCPKMYVCKRCNQKQFSVLSDLRTHEKHCGDHKWQCSCGTTFSRKDKLMGHCALFVGHTPVSTSSSSGKIEQ